MKRCLGLSALILINLIIFFVVPTGWASHESSGAQAVPLSELWEFYGAIGHYDFVVRECGFTEFEGGFQTGDLASAARSAASTWERTFPAISIAISTAPCSYGFPDFRNNEDEIYWSGFRRGAAEVGDYFGYFVLDGTLLEHDITVEPVGLADFANDHQMSIHTALYNIVLHELGHALGLNDAYIIDLDGCDWSVMLKLCAGPEMSPQPADIAALQHIYGLAPRPNSEVPQPPQPAPPPPPSSAGGLRKFDLNQNGTIDDEELFYAVDLWTMGELPDEEFYQVTDAWIRQVQIASAKSSTLKSREKRAAPALTAVEVYNANGLHIASLSCSTGNASARVARALKQLRSPVGTYILVTRDCNNNQTKISRSLFKKN